MTQVNEKWRAVRLDDVCDVILGQSPPGDTYNAVGDGLPFFQGKAEFGDMYPKPVKWCSAPTKIAEPEDVLMSVRAPVGPTNLAPSKACIGRGLVALRPKNGIPSRYVLYAVRATVQTLAEKATGSTFEAVSGAQVRAHEIPLAPSYLQAGIVEEIEAQLSRLEAGVSALKRAQANLKRYRAAVLKAACEGRLVPTEAELARAEGRDYETGEQLVARIREIRHQKVGSTSVSSEKDKAYRGLVEGWWVTTVEQLTVPNRKSAYGVLQPGDHVSGGVPLVRVGDIDNGRVDESQLKLIASTIDSKYPRTRLQGGELLMTLVGAIGRTAIVSTNLRGANVARAVGVIPLTPNINAAWAELWFRNPDQIARMVERSHEVARKTLNLEDVRSAPVAVPPLDEQNRIVAEVERRLSVVDELEATIAANLRRATRLRQAILQQAFGISPGTASGKPSALSERGNESDSVPTRNISLSMNKDSVTGIAELVRRLTDHGEEVTAEALFNLSGLVEDVDRFYELIREGRDKGLLFFQGNAMKTTISAHAHS